MKNHVKKRIVFYFYAFKDFLENDAIKINLKCLKYYSSIFDEALFIISVDDINDAGLISSAEKEIINCGFENIRFKVHEDNQCCEAQPFFEEIFQKLEKLDGLTFFGHTKGVTKTECKAIVDWILGLYYLNLNFTEEAEHLLTYEGGRFFGTFLTDGTDSWMNGFFFNGTFYWMNCPTIYEDYMLNKIKLPETFGNRAFAESLPAVLKYTPYNNGLVSHDMWYYGDGYNYYNDIDKLIPVLLNANKYPEEFQKFLDFKEEILKGINLTTIKAR